MGWQQRIPLMFRVICLFRFDSKNIRCIFLYLEFVAVRGTKTVKKTLCQFCVNLIGTSWHLVTQHATSATISLIKIRLNKLHPCFGSRGSEVQIHSPRPLLGMKNMKKFLLFIIFCASLDMFFSTHLFGLDSVKKLKSYKVCKRCNLVGINLIGVNLKKADLKKSNLSGANLTQANLQNSNLEQAYLQTTNLTEANLIHANLQKAYLNEADLKRANLSNTNIRSAHLKGADLEEANLFRARLNGANLSGANLNGANLEESDLQGANLQGTSFKNANLSHAKLVGANIKKDGLRGAILCHTKTPWGEENSGCE